MIAEVPDQHGSLRGCHAAADAFASTLADWERELIGLYISDHPLTPYQETFAQIVSYFSGQLNQAQHEEKVRVAGLITAIRDHVMGTLFRTQMLA